MHARDPRRLKRVYRRFHLAVCAVFVLVWLGSLGGLALLAREAGAGAAVEVAAGVVLGAVAGALAWWGTAGALLMIAVRSGALPPFGLAPYLRSGRFPSHWIAAEHAAVGQAGGDD